MQNHIGYEEWNAMATNEQEELIRKDAAGEVQLKQPHIGSFAITTRFPEDYSKSHNGGDYEEWDKYIALDTDGLFAVFSHTSCDFDDCDTGYEGVVAVSESDYQCLLEEENARYIERG